MAYRGWDIAFRFEILHVGALGAKVVFYKDYQGTPVKMSLKDLNKLLKIISREPARRTMILDKSACSDIKKEFEDSKSPAIKELRKMMWASGL